MNGYVYILRDLNTGLVKIGRTTDPSRRKTELGVGSPSHFVYLNTIECADYEAEEKYLHSIFRRHRVKGEWYNLSDDVIEWLKTFDRAPTEFVVH